MHSGRLDVSVAVDAEHSGICTARRSDDFGNFNRPGVSRHHHLFPCRGIQVTELIGL